MSNLITRIRESIAVKGDHYYMGEEIPADYPKAIRYFRLGSLLGDAYSAFRLGYLYENGLGCREDCRKALAGYRKAAARGDVDSMVCIGDLYRDGKLGTADPKEALAWYRRAAMNGLGMGALKEQLLVDQMADSNQ